MRFSFLFGATLLLLILPLAACGNGGGGGGGGPNPPPPPPSPDPLSLERVSLAERLSSSHLDNGFWDWRQNSFPYDTSVAGFQNVSGITALGLAETWLYDQTTDVPQLSGSVAGVLTETRDALLGLMQDFLDDVEPSVSLPNFIFMKVLQDAGMVNAADWTIVEQAFTKLAFDRDASNGDVPGIVADGLFNRILDGRTGQGLADLAGWDCAFIYKAMLCMDWPQVELDWLQEALSLLPFHFGEPFSVLSASHIAEVCAIHGDLVGCATRLIQVEGAFQAETVGTSVEGDHQSTCYAVLALAAYGEDVSALQEWLVSEIGLDGSFVESDGFEYFEIMGECLQALFP